MNDETYGRHGMRASRTTTALGASSNQALENGAKVNMIKQKFERNASPNEKPTRLRRHNDLSDHKECLRRSLSASPVKSKKNLKLEVSRQLSNPGGKNIKRTPAFRGDKLSRIKNLQSPTKERQVSIVDQNVRIFEDSPDRAKTVDVDSRTDETATKERNERGSYGSKAILPKNSRINDRNGVRTTVISRQTNISPIYKRDEQLATTAGRTVDVSSSSGKDGELEKFVKNGAEYTRVRKQCRPTFANDDKSLLSSRSRDNGNFKTNGDAGIGIMDVREELSRRIYRSTDDNYDQVVDYESSDTVDGESMDENKFFGTTNDKSFDDKTFPTNNEKISELSDTLKAALQAPLPVGPPPKKPPRTFVHNPVKQMVIALEETQIRLPKSTNSPTRDEKSTNSTRVNENGKTVDAKSRDSKKMLAKLENVLIQHQKALGAKVIMPRTDTRDKSIAGDDDKRKSFYNRLSRTLEDSKKLGSLPKIPSDAKTRKHSTFECLPSLNCANFTSVYEQVRNPDFKSYFTETSCLRELKCSIGKSEESLETSLSNMLAENSEFVDEPASSKRLSTELTTFNDVKKRDSGKIEKTEERVYAEPFAFDENSGTDITGYGMLSSNEHNYFSRSLRKQRFGNSADNFIFPRRNCESSPSRLSRSDDIADAKPGLHYMCTSIQPLVYEDNNNEVDNDCTTSKMLQRSMIMPKKNISINANDVSPSSEKICNEMKTDQLLNQAFGRFSMSTSKTPTDSNTSSDTDSLASSPSIGDQPSSFNRKLRIFETRDNVGKPTKEELHRSLTEKRKTYARRVSSRYSENRKIGSLVDRRDKLFQVCLLVELNLSTREPYIKDKYPVYAKTPAWIENFCFPDATDWPPNDAIKNQFYSLVLMDERGNRRYGYCCRVRPEDGPVLPLAYCLITKHRASGFYRKVLLELESRHGLPDRKRRSFIEELYNSAMPKPGQTLRMSNNDDDDDAIVLDRSTRINDEILKNKNSLATKLDDFNDDRGASRRKIVDRNTVMIVNERTTTNFGDSPFAEKNVIVRSGDPRFEERDTSQLFDAVTDKAIIVLFGSLLLERKLVLMCDKIGKLSSCVDALQSLLYPFTWPHTFIPVLPDIPGLSEILQAPLPYVIGILKSKNSANKDVAMIRDGIVIDLDTSKIIFAVGDESSILPARLQKGIRSALQLVHSRTKSGEGIRNVLVSEAFLRVLVETCSHYDSHLATQQDGKIVFQKESFIKAPFLSKSVQYFLEWFVETTMFNVFIQDCIARMEDETIAVGDDVKLFNQRAAEFRKQRSEKNAETKNGSAKKKTLGDRLKDLTNFHT